MLIPYTYSPTTQDLWLYEDYTATYSGGSVATKRPIAWNPNSPLYGYRNSIQGISTRLRVFNNYCGSSLATHFGSYNNAALDANKPVFYNSFPMHFVLVSDLFMFGCLHCYGQSGARSATEFYVGNGGYGVNSIFDVTTMFRWLDGDDNVIETRSPSSVLRGFTSHSGYTLQCRNDLSLFELPSASSVPPVVVVDPRTIGYGATAWMLDSNHKIVRLSHRNSYVEAGVDKYSFQAVKPDGTALPESVQMFSGDSQSIVLVEIHPPSDPSAGDGVLGVVSAHVMNPNELAVASDIRAGYGDITAEGTLANSATSLTHLRDYCSARGSAMPNLQRAARQGEIATETKEQQILTILQGL
jgi:hypothetical protein